LQRAITTFLKQNHHSQADVVLPPALAKGKAFLIRFVRCTVLIPSSCEHTRGKACFQIRTFHACLFHFNPTAADAGGAASKSAGQCQVCCCQWDMFRTRHHIACLTVCAHYSPLQQPGRWKTRNPPTSLQQHQSCDTPPTKLWRLRIQKESPLQQLQQLLLMCLQQTLRFCPCSMHMRTHALKQQPQPLPA